MQFLLQIAFNKKVHINLLQIQNHIDWYMLEGNGNSVSNTFLASVRRRRRRRRRRRP